MATGDPGNPRMYTELASWWPLLSAPEEYLEEATFYSKTLLGAVERPTRTLLELGSGGGNNASHMKKHFQPLVLVDRSPGMIAVSKTLNPDCEHVIGDMRTVRLERQFDYVFVHDAIVYMTTTADLRQAIETAFVHCAPGGAALFAPDHVRENFRASTDHGGHDGTDRAMRFLDVDLGSRSVGQHVYRGLLVSPPRTATGRSTWSTIDTSKDYSPGANGSES